MSRENLEQLILEKPQVGLQITHLLSERLRQYETRLGDLTLKSTTARLASLILLLAENEGIVTSEKLIKIPQHYTHQYLGTMVGTNREAVTRAFAELQDKGALELRRRLIWVTNIDTLRYIASAADEQEQTS